MAEFKIGRLRFVWRGVWTIGYDYVKDDVVRVGGSSYVCVTGHQSSGAFSTDAANWERMQEGILYRAAWAPATIYENNDIVVYGGIDIRRHILAHRLVAHRIIRVDHVRPILELLRILCLLSRYNPEHDLGPDCPVTWREGNLAAAVIEMNDEIEALKAQVAALLEAVPSANRQPNDRL